MATEPDPTSGPRVPLSRDRVLRTAVRLADEGGLESLSMRKLGQELGVQAMSLYNHVAGKDDLRDAIVELVLAEIEIPSGGDDWKESIRRSAISAHDVLVRHSWAAALLHTASVSEARLQWMEGILKTLRKAGFSADLTHHAYHALDSHITGFTLWQVSFPFQTREEFVAMAETVLPEIPPDVYPYLVEHAEQHLTEPDPEEKSEFEFGLDLILDGLERLRDAA